MVHASSFLSEEERKQIGAAVRAAESSTSGEIVPVLATASGDYDRPEDLAGLWLALIGLVCMWWIGLDPETPGNWDDNAVRVNWVGLLIALGVVVVGFTLGAILAAHLGWLRRLFTSRRLMRLEVERAAARAFFEHGIRKTKARIGILIYVSIFERMVRVTGDSNISEKLGDRDWARVRDEILEGIRRGRPAEGLINGILRCGEILSQHFPAEENDVDELSNDLRIIH